MPVSKNVVIIGGGLVGLELAEYLVERKRTVTVLEPGPAFGPELSIVRRARVLHQLEAHGTALHPSVEDIHIGRRAVTFSLAGERQVKACDQVIIAMGAQPDNQLSNQLAATGAQIHRVGDCRRVGYIDGAILDARKLVQQLDAMP